MDPDDVSCSPEQALYTADWLLRFARDRVDDAAFRPHSIAAEVQLRACRNRLSDLISSNPPQRMSA